MAAKKDTRSLAQRMKDRRDIDKDIDAQSRGKAGPNTAKPRTPPKRGKT